MMRQPISYAWALHTDVSAVAPEGLPEDAYRGLEYARELAGAAKARSRQNVVNEQAFTSLTIAALAARNGVAASTLRRRIGKARRALFGDLSDAAIYKRVQRQRQSARRFRHCEHPGCDKHLAAKAHRNQKYCNDHRTPAERVRRYRKQSA
jgi:hypothetical protein